MKELDIPKGWKEVKLKECIKEINDRTIENNQYEVLTSSKSGIYSQEEYFDKQVASKDSTGYKIIKRGQFTYRSMSDNGTFTINRLENKDIGIVSPAYPVFEAININAEYLKYFFQSEVFRKAIYNLSQGSTRTALKYKDLSNIEILLPPIEEQEKIVEILKTIDFIIEKYENLLEEKNQFIKSQFVEMFGDVVKGTKYNENQKAINDIAFVTKLAGFEFTDYIKYQDSGDIIMLRGLNCKNGRLVLDNIKWIDKEISDMLPRSKLFIGDILMTYAGTIADVAMVDEDDKYHLAPNVAKISINNRNEVNPIFIMYTFMMTHNYIKSFASKTSQPSISMEKIRKFTYYLPPIELQNQFTEFVKLIDKQKLLLEKQKQNYEKLKKGLMQKLLTGKVRVKI